MAEGSSGGGGGGVSSSSRAAPSYVKLGDRQIFTVELRPGETTFVSWRKLMKDANKSNSGSAPSAEPPPANAHSNLESHVAPGQPAEKEGKDAPPTNWFGAVIEKIERLYMGKDSSDEEDLKDIPDDDQYDTEDSFIDDAELDEYFEVDNSAIKHDGFFVNRGKLERISEPTVVPSEQPKKRRRKDLTKVPGEGDDGRASNKHVKMGKSSAGRVASLLGNDISGPAQNLTVTNEYYGDLKSHNPSNAPGTSSKKKSETKMDLDPSLSTRVSNGDASVSLAEMKDIEKLKTGGPQAKSLTNKLKDTGGSLDASYLKYHDKASYAQSKLQSAKPINQVDEFEPSVRSKEKNGIRELPDLNIPQGKISLPATKSSNVHKKDGSSVRPKGSMLEKAIRELEKLVAESRPPAVENQEADASSQAIKRRLPGEIKLKLAKVARLAQASQGKVSKELINRLMSILGHLIQLRTLKRNLKVMISMGLSEKQKKDDRFQHIKKEVAEMIKTRIPSLEKAFEQQAGASDDFQEIGSEERGVLKRKFSMDTVLEDKICELYDLFVDGMDEDAGPQVRKLYVELAQLWPSGFMDNHGIKRAICRAKERRRAMHSRRHEKIERKKMVASRLDETARAEASAVAEPQYSRDKLATDTAGPILALASRPMGPISNSSTSAVRVPSPSMNANLDKLKQEKPKESSSNYMDEAKIGPDGALTKKKVKRKPEQELDETHLRSEKSHLQSSEERNKSLKQASGLAPKLNLNLQSTASSFEQSG